jgi:hypothetical protein
MSDKSVSADVTAPTDASGFNLELRRDAILAFTEEGVDVIFSKEEKEYFDPDGKLTSRTKTQSLTFSRRRGPPDLSKVSFGSGLAEAMNRRALMEEKGPEPDDVKVPGAGPPPAVSSSALVPATPLYGQEPKTEWVDRPYSFEEVTNRKICAFLKYEGEFYALCCMTLPSTPDKKSFYASLRLPELPEPKLRASTAEASEFYARMVLNLKGSRPGGMGSRISHAGEKIFITEFFECDEGFDGKVGKPFDRLKASKEHLEVIDEVSKTLGGDQVIGCHRRNVFFWVAVSKCSSDAKKLFQKPVRDTILDGIDRLVSLKLTSTS